MHHATKLRPSLILVLSAVFGTYSAIAADETVNLDKFHVRGEQTTDDTYGYNRIITATRTNTLLRDVPQSVSVITRELIDDQGMRGIADVVRYVPGAGIAQGEGNRDTPVLRGNSSTAAFFVDGIRDDVEYFRDLYNIDRIEALKGPNAMIFGRGATGGLINRVTTQANERTVREFTLQGGSWNQRRATVDLGQKVAANLAARVTGVYENSDSYRDGVGVERRGVNPTFAWAVQPQTTIRFGYEYFKDERVADRGVSSFQGRPLRVDASMFFGDPAQSPTHARVNAAFATVEHRASPTLLIRNTSRFASYDKFYQNVYPGAVNAAGTSVSISAYNNGTQRDNLYNQTDVITAFQTGAIKHEFLAGAELGRQVTDNRRLTGYFTSVSPTTTSVSVPLSNPQINLPLAFAPSATDADNHGVAQTVAFYAQDQIAFTRHLHAVLGLRYEDFAVDFRNNRTGAVVAARDQLVSPRAGLIVKPIESVSLYASFSLSYLPRAGEQLASLSLTNRALDPEKFQNYEIGAKWDLRSNLSLSAAVYRLERNNVAIPDPADVTRSLLVDGQRADGFELGVSGKLAAGWSIVGGYAYQEGEILATQSTTVVRGARLTQLPRHSFSLWNRYEVTPRWGVGAGVIHRGEIFASTDNTVTLPGFTRLDAALFFKLNENVRAQLNVENVLDRYYYASAHSNTNVTPGSPRAFRLSVTTRF